jgi:ferredoxin
MRTYLEMLLVSVSLILIMLSGEIDAILKSPFSLKRNLHALKMADVEITWYSLIRLQIDKTSYSFTNLSTHRPNNKKCKVPEGSSLKDAAKKAGFSPNYGCEEGKCGSCELKIAGKKIRPCIGKAPKGPAVKLESP